MDLEIEESSKSIVEAYESEEVVIDVCDIEIVIRHKTIPMVCEQEYGVISARFDKLKNQVSSKNRNHDLGKEGVSPSCCRNSHSNIRNLLKLLSLDIKMAFQTKKVDMKNLTPAPDRPRIFMSNKTSKVVVVFPNGEVVEGKLLIDCDLFLDNCQDFVDRARWLCR